MAESAVVAFLRGNGWLSAERRALHGSLDQGDVTGTPGLVWEVKYANGGVRMAGWIAQTEVERLNASADYGILVIKPAAIGATQTNRWFAVMMAESFERLQQQAIQETKGFSPHVVMLGPHPYSAPIMFTKLFAARLGPDMGAVRMYPPGGKEHLNGHYVAIYLEDMVRLLHAAGYGSVLPKP